MRIWAVLELLVRVPAFKAVAGAGHLFRIGKQSRRAIGIACDALITFDKFAVVQIERDSVGVDRPLGVEGDGAVRFGGEIAHLLPVLVGSTGAIGSRVPLIEGVAGVGENVGGEGLGLIVGEVLAGHFTLAVVGVKLYGVFVGRPLGVKRDGAVLFGGENGHLIPLLVGSTGAIGRRVPLVEGVAGPARRGWDGKAVVTVAVRFVKHDLEHSSLRAVKSGVIVIPPDQILPPRAIFLIAVQQPGHLAGGELVIGFGFNVCNCTVVDTPAV